MDELNSIERIICFCHDVSDQQILAAIQNGAKDLYSIQCQTFASTGCGGCESDILEILESGLEASRSLEDKR